MPRRRLHIAAAAALLACTFVVGCATEEDEPVQSEPRAATALNGLSMNNLSSNGITVNGLAINGLGENGLSFNGLSFNGLLDNGLLANGLSFNGMTVNGLSFNGLSFNGVGDNGLSFNGLSLNGLSFNGLSFNGLTLNGLSFNGVGENGITLNGLSFNGLSFNGVTLNGLSFNGLSLNGLSFNGIGDNGLSFNGLSFNNLSINGLSFNGLSLNGLSFNGISLNGLSFNGLSFNGLSLNGLSFNGLTDNGLSFNSLADNGISLNGLTLNGLSFNGLSFNSIAVDGISLADLSLDSGSLAVTTIDGAPLDADGEAAVELVYDYLVGCALADGDSVTIDGTVYDGYAGVAPSWKSAPLSVDGSRAVTECVAAYAADHGSYAEAPFALSADETAALEVALYHMIGCALADGDAVTIEDTTYHGARGLAPEWTTRAITADENALVAACVASTTDPDVVSTDAAFPLTDEQRETLRLVLRYLVACALDDGDSVAIDGVVYDGLRGYAPNWKTQPLTQQESEDVRACVASSPGVVALGPAYVWRSRAQRDKFQTLLQYLVECALEPDQVVSVSGAGAPYTISGALGIYPNLYMPQLNTNPVYDDMGKKHVSGCLAARVNATGNHVQLSIRGKRVLIDADGNGSVDEWIALDPGEDTDFPSFEGMFWVTGPGGLFGDDPRVFACAGDVMGDPNNGTEGRLCATSPEQCGFSVGGSCDDMCDSFGICSSVICSDAASCHIVSAIAPLETYLPATSPAIPPPEPGLAVAWCAPSYVAVRSTTTMTATLRNEGAIDLTGLTVNLVRDNTTGLELLGGAEVIAGVDIPAGEGRTFSWDFEGASDGSGGTHAVAVVDAAGRTVSRQKLVYAVRRSQDEVRAQCETAPACGDGHCTGGETCGSCAGDCGVCGGGEGAGGGSEDPVCGNGVCEVGESCDGSAAGTTACDDCDGVTGGKPAGRYCYVNGTCEGAGCP